MYISNVSLSFSSRDDRSYPPRPNPRVIALRREITGHRCNIQEQMLRRAQRTAGFERRYDYRTRDAITKIKLGTEHWPANLPALAFCLPPESRSLTKAGAGFYVFAPRPQTINDREWNFRNLDTQKAAVQLIATYPVNKNPYTRLIVGPAPYLIPVGDLALRPISQNESLKQTKFPLLRGLKALTYGQLQKLQRLHARVRKTLSGFQYLKPQFLALHPSRGEKGTSDFTKVISVCPLSGIVAYQVGKSDAVLFHPVRTFIAQHPEFKHLPKQDVLKTEVQSTKTRAA